MQGERMLWKKQSDKCKVNGNEIHDWHDSKNGQKTVFKEILLKLEAKIRKICEKW